MGTPAGNQRLFFVLEDGTEIELESKVQIIDVVYLDIHDLISAVLIMDGITHDHS